MTDEGKATSAMNFADEAVKMAKGSDGFVMPPDIKFKSAVFDAAFHPTENIIAVGLVTGFLKIYRLGAPNTLLHSVHVHKKAIRSLTFSHDGKFVFTASSDKTIKATSVTSGEVLHTMLAAHPAPINVISINPDGSLLFSGDDEGEIRVWDISSPAEFRPGSAKHKPKHSWHVHHDFISCLVNPPSSRYLIAGSGDGCMSGWNLAEGDVDGVSENLNDEVLSVCPMPNKKRILCGTQAGIIQCFDWGAWGEPVHTYRGHPNSVESIIVVDNNTVITGSSDGLIRVVQISPHKILGVIGDHEDMPVERLRLNASKTILLSTSHDEMVHFWDVRMLYEDDDEEELEKENETVAEEELHPTDVAADGDGSDDDDDDDDGDDGDDDDMEEDGEEGSSGPKKRKRPNMGVIEGADDDSEEMTQETSKVSEPQRKQIKPAPARGKKRGAGSGKKGNSFFSGL